ncbi:alpha-tocopherol transfer protein-like [Pogonomyrmex barbatus]|uniref:Alpha-tocopherol transfer protein-like n=1 Tax=Pogonomyrmex barbatus TaxID=144034 RepID=A0A6I9X1D7_9HYME|nr:alpha-tocopherol transfer protein-like [Pogonomyrmex barbatus]
MAASMMEETVKSPMLAAKEKMFQHWQINAPKIKFGEHQLSIEITDLDDFFIEKAKKELRETPEIVAQSFKQLREYIAGEPDLHIPDDVDFYVIFLRPCKWYAKKCFLLKRYYRFRQHYPHIFDNLLITKERTALCAGLIYPLPLRTKEGCRLMIIEVGKRWKPKEVSIDDFFKGLMIILYLAMTEYRTQIAGTHIIMDADGLSLSHLTYITPSFAKMVVDFVQKCLPTRLKGIHIVNQSFIFNMAFAIFKPFLEEKIRKRIHFHGTNWDSLTTFAEKRVLLKKHGGELDMPEEPFGMHFWENMLSCEPAFVEMINYGYKTDKGKI